MTKPAILLATVFLVAAAPKLSKYEQRALQYLDPKVQPRPVVPDPQPDFEEFTYRDHFCWARKEGVVCSACYNHPKRYLGQMLVLCQWSRTDCRYVIYADEGTRLGIDRNQCVVP